MFYSEKYKLLYIASPKTGSVSVHEALEKIDPSGLRRKIIFRNKIITGSELKQGIIGHARAREIKNALGSDDFFKLNTIAFIRNPYHKLVSSYHFNKSNSLSHTIEIKGKKNRFKRSLNYFLTTLFAKVLPFKLWAIFYPYRSNKSYLTDYDGKLIVKHIGRTEFLNDDFHKIMKELKINSQNIVVGKRNISKHSSPENYFKSKFFKKIMYRKMKDDVELYEKICKTLV